MEYMRVQIMICCPQYPVTLKLLSYHPVLNLPLYVIHLVVQAKFRNNVKGQTQLNETNRNPQHMQFL
jgi:hypothetical protein